ncbi:hypothetical protein COBT_002007 [Conglomerata obtusa]
MLLKENQLVIILNGRFTGKKGIVLNVSDESVTTAIITPSTRRTKLKVNIRNMNPKHLIITRYVTDLVVDKVDDKKQQAELVINGMAKLKEVGKGSWLYSKIKF